MVDQPASPADERPDQAVYRGEDIVDAGSFFRRLPHCVDQRQRLRLEALVYSADVLAHSFTALRQLAFAAGPDPKVDQRTRTMMFASAWLIVDHLNVARQILTDLAGGKPTVESKPFLEAVEPARTLHNRMSHLAQNLHNIPGQKVRRPPIVGRLGYFFLTDVRETPEGTVPKSGVVVALTTGLTHGTEAMPMVNPARQIIGGPVDLFQLHAFTETLLLGPPLALLRSTLARMAERMESDLNRQVQAQVDARGVDPESLLQPVGGSYTVAMPIQFNADAGAQEEGRAASP